MADTRGVDRYSPDALSRNADALRGELRAVVDELGRRGRRLVDWRGQLRRHGGLLVGFALAAAALAFFRWRHQRALPPWRR